MNHPLVPVVVLVFDPMTWLRGRGRERGGFCSWSSCIRKNERGLSMNRRRSRQVLECAGRAQRRRRFGFSPHGQGITEFRRAGFAESKAAWRFASRRTPNWLLTTDRAGRFWRLTWLVKRPLGGYESIVAETTRRHCLSHRPLPSQICYHS